MLAQNPKLRKICQIEKVNFRNVKKFQDGYKKINTSLFMTIGQTFAMVQSERRDALEERLRDQPGLACFRHDGRRVKVDSREIVPTSLADLCRQKTQIILIYFFSIP